MIYPTVGSLPYLLLEIITAFIFSSLLLGLHRKVIARYREDQDLPLSSISCTPSNFI
jgi:TRAP-type C4-dicarboxylate transport system permease small subunit